MKSRSNQGMASFAVILFAIVAMMMLMANFKMASAVNITTDAFDTYQSQIVEKNGVAQIVKESILSIRETAISQSTNSVQTEIQRRLANMTFPAGISLTLTTSPTALPGHPFFPATPPAATNLAYFTSGPRGIAGMGALLTSLAMMGPAADLGRLTFTFNRTNSADANDSRVYTVNADLVSMPLTNVDLVAYGLPTTGVVPDTAPPIPIGMIGPGVSQMVVTANNPAGDPTAYPDLYPAGGAETLPYQFRNASSFCWNAYEYVWSLPYQHALIAAAQAEADPGNEAPTVDNPAPGVGAVYDFSAANNPAIAGFTGAGNGVVIDCQSVQSAVVAVVDSQGNGSVMIRGSATPGPPIIIVIRNTAGGLGRTAVHFTGNNIRPALFYLENCAATFGGRPQIQGAFFLDRTTTASGATDLVGHLSFYSPASPLATWDMTLSDSSAVKGALAGIAPRVLLVATSATR
jgi:hypothetical protein